MASPFLIANKPTLSKSQGTVVKGSNINLLGNMPAGNYTIITNPVKTSSGKIIDAADTQTISYSASMKEAAQELAKTGNPLEKAAANFYLFMDDPNKRGSAKYYENQLKKLGLDITEKSNTGNGARDFALDVVKGFVGSPAQTARVIASGGLGATLLAKEQDKAKTIKGGAQNAVTATVQGITDSPGMFVGGALAGVAGTKGIGILTKKPSIPATIKTGDFKQTKVSKSVNTLDADYTIKGTSYKFKNKSTGGKRKNKQRDSNVVMRDSRGNVINITPEARIAQQLNQNLRRDRGRGVAAKIEFSDIGTEYNPRKNNPAFAIMTVKSDKVIMTVKSDKVLGGSKRGRTKVIYDKFDLKRNSQTALTTAKEARRPKNTSQRERERVRRVIEAQRQSGALFQDMQLSVRIIPMRISTEKGLITAADARKPRNRTDKERRRVQMVRMIQEKSGAAKPSAAKYLDYQREGRKRQRGGRNRKGSGTKKGKTLNTRRPRAYETKVPRIASIEEIPGIYKVEYVPRYAVGVSRPAKIRNNQNYTLELKPISGYKSARGRNAIERAGRPKPKRTMEEIREKQEYLRLIKQGLGTGGSSGGRPSIPYGFGGYNVDMFVQHRSKPIISNNTPAPKKTNTASSKKAGYRGDSYIEVDNGNGTVGLVKSKKEQTSAKGKPADAKTKAKSEKPKGSVNRKATKPLPKNTSTKQTKPRGENSTKTAEYTKIQSKPVQATSKTAPLTTAPAAVLQAQKQETLTLTKAGSGKTVTPKPKPPVIVPSKVTIQKPTQTPKQDGEGKTKTKTRMLPAQKPDGKSKQQKIKRTPKSGTPKTKTKKTSRLRLKEEEKKKKKRVVKVKDDGALRLETVNQFGWLGIDKKPAAKPRKIK